jgi:hypothetical protein
MREARRARRRVRRREAARGRRRVGEYLEEKLQEDEGEYEICNKSMKARSHKSTKESTREATGTRGEKPERSNEY